MYFINLEMKINYLHFHHNSFNVEENLEQKEEVKWENGR